MSPPAAMTTADGSCRTRFGLLVGSHVGLGIAMGLIAYFSKGNELPIWLAIWFIGLVSSEMLLLGMWIGLANARWWLKLIGLVAGTAWLVVLAISPDPSSAQYFWEELVPFIAIPVVVFAGACWCGRHWLARMQQQNEWEPLPAANELQFTMKSLGLLILAIAVILALGRLTRDIDAGSGGFVVTVFTISLTALLAGTMLIWACLGPGRISVRIPIALVGMAAVGLIFPYYVGGPEWRFLVWPVLTLVLSGYVVASLLVVRSCGYRLVALERKPSQ
jgi:hypothetical protein